jgi:signal transduction histidine kinase
MMHDQIPGPLSTRQQEYMSHVLDNGKRLLHLLNGLLDLSSIEAGKLALMRSQVDMSSIFEASLTMVKEETSRHDVTLTLCVSDGLNNVCVFADELRLRQIIFNLMSNAAKFTPAGGTINLEVREGPDHLTISVRDTGIGIRPEDHHRIFNAFEQVEGSYSRPYQGSGLGLALTKKLVELHGGQIWVQSEGQGRGSTFSFTIPTEKSESEAKGPVTTSMLSSLLPKRDL